ncbi:MAG: hypothetical protein IAF94_20995 [Pirellulaceae bacterium]|nr:hypothetical protein [Pirellulaceae bacterium]
MVVANLLKPVASEQSAPSDSGRMRAREYTKGELGRHAVAIRDLREQERQIAIMEARSNRADESHTAATAPLLAKIKAIKDRMASAGGNGLPFDPADEDELRGLEDEKLAAAEVLATETAIVEKLVKPMREQWEKMRGALPNRDVLQSRLAGEELGNPELLKAKFVATELVRLLEPLSTQVQRVLVDKAEADVQMIQDDAKNMNVRPDPRELANAQKKLDRWTAVWRAIREIQAKAGADVTRLQRELIAE